VFRERDRRRYFAQQPRKGAAAEAAVQPTNFWFEWNSGHTAVALRVPLVTLGASYIFATMLLCGKTMSSC
jgi:hypothetical protein